MKGQTFRRAFRITVHELTSLATKVLFVLAAIIFLMTATNKTPPLPAGQYDLKGSIEAAKQQEKILRAQAAENRKKAAEARERLYARSQKLYDLMTDPNGDYKYNHDKAIKILKAWEYLTDRLE